MIALEPETSYSEAQVNTYSTTTPLQQPISTSIVVENNKRQRHSKMKKTCRDPGAPKRNMSAYLLYQNAMREQFKAQNPHMTFGELAKYTSAMYSEMLPEEKNAWVDRAEADKARYLQELASYTPPPGYDAKGDAISTYAKATKSGKRRKPERDDNAPKRNVSAYLLYQNAMREQFKRENPAMTFGQLAKYTSHMYKNLSVGEKAIWTARAAQDKTRYEAEIATYVPPPGHDSKGNAIGEYQSGKRQRREKKDPAAPKRARGSFVFFTFEVRPLVQKEYPGIKFVEMGTILGERWRALSPEQKKRYEDMAAEDKIRFNVEMDKYTANKASNEQVLQQAMVQTKSEHIPTPDFAVSNSVPQSLTYSYNGQIESQHLQQQEHQHFDHKTLHQQQQHHEFDQTILNQHQHEHFGHNVTLNEQEHPHFDQNELDQKQEHQHFAQAQEHELDQNTLGQHQEHHNFDQNTLDQQQDHHHFDQNALGQQEEHHFDQNIIDQQQEHHHFDQNTLDQQQEHHFDQSALDQQQEHNHFDQNALDQQDNHHFDHNTLGQQQEHDFDQQQEHNFDQNALDHHALEQHTLEQHTLEQQYQYHGQYHEA